MNVLSLFSGIGGLDLGLERAGMTVVVGQVEIDPFCQRSAAIVETARARGETRSKLCLGDEDIQTMRGFRTDGMSVKAVATLFGVTPKYASAVMAGSRTRSRSHTGPTRSALKLIDARSNGYCEFMDCAAAAVHTHHRKPRRAGGSTDPAINLPSNLLRLCFGHHEWVESNRREALAMGLLLHANDNPVETPVAMRLGLVYLNDAGDYSVDPP